MTSEQRNEYIEDLIFYTRIARSYYERLTDARLLEEWEKMQLIY